MGRTRKPQASASYPRYWSSGRCAAYHRVKTPTGAMALCAPRDWWEALYRCGRSRDRIYQYMPPLAVEVWPLRGPRLSSVPARVGLARADSGLWLFAAVWEGPRPAACAIERMAPAGRPGLILYSEAYPGEVLTNCIVASGLG